MSTIFLICFIYIFSFFNFIYTNQKEDLVGSRSAVRWRRLSACSAVSSHGPTLSDFLCSAALSLSLSETSPPAKIQVRYLAPRSGSRCQEIFVAFPGHRLIAGVLGTAADRQWWRCGEKVRHRRLARTGSVGRGVDAAENTG